jgi:hypothetical protein
MAVRFISAILLFFYYKYDDRIASGFSGGLANFKKHGAPPQTPQGTCPLTPVIKTGHQRCAQECDLRAISKLYFSLTFSIHFEDGRWSGCGAVFV